MMLYRKSFICLICIFITKEISTICFRVFGKYVIQSLL